MAIILTIKVVPQAGCVDWACDKSGMVKCYLKSAPEGGKANHELIKLLAKALDCPQNDIMIVSGVTSRIKKIKITCAHSLEQVYDALGLERQHGIL